MTIHYEIEYQTPQEQYDILEVDLLGDVTLEDDTYSDEYGLVRKQPYPTLDDVKWVRSDFSDDENAIIEQHVKDNFQKIEQLFIKKHNKDYD